MAPTGSRLCGVRFAPSTFATDINHMVDSYRAGMGTDVDAMEKLFVLFGRTDVDKVPEVSSFIEQCLVVSDYANRAIAVAIARR